MRPGIFPGRICFEREGQATTSATCTVAESAPAVPLICSGKLPVGVVMAVETLIVADVGVWDAMVAVANGGRPLTWRAIVEEKPPLGAMVTLYVVSAPGATVADCG